MVAEDAHSSLFKVARVLTSQRAEGQQMSVYAERTDCRFGRLGCLWASLALSVFACQVKRGLGLDQIINKIPVYALILPSVLHVCC